MSVAQLNSHGLSLGFKRAATEGPPLPGVDKHAIPRKWRENPKGNKEIWESSVRLGHKKMDICGGLQSQEWIHL